MENGKNNFKEVFCPWILKTFPPISLVFSSPNAQKILGKNFLSPSLFMRPFGNLSETSLVFMFNEKYQNIVNDFKLDFYEPKDFIKVENNLINNYIINCLSSENVMPTFESSFIKLNKNDIKNFLLQLNQYSPKYYTEFEKLFFELCKCQETELYQQPLLYVYICDINDDVNIISNIYSKNIPRLIKSGAYEQKILDVLILLNDKSDKINQNLNKLVLESNFKNKYYDKEIITIDINSGNKNDLSEDIWSKYIHKMEEYTDGFEPIKRGRYITKTEINTFKQKFSNYIKNKFRPKLIELINNLDKNLSKSSGLNSLFNKFKTSKIETKDYIIEYRIQKLSSTEKQRYFLSLLLFHIRDYKDAYENLKKLSDSIKGKNKDYENAIKQFLIICRYMKKEHKLEIDTLAPLQTYLDNRQYLMAYRNIMLYLKMTEQLKLEGIIDNIYKYNYYLMNHNIKYFIGLLYEKIGFYFLINKKPKPRKFAFNILNYAAKNYLLEKESDIKNYYLIQNFGYILDLFKIDYDYSEYDNFDSICTFFLTKQFIFKSLCNACDTNNNIRLGIPIFYNYLKFLLLEQSNYNNKLNNSLIKNKVNENEEINLYFQKLNSLLIKGKINFLENFPIPIIHDNSLVFYLEQEIKLLKNSNGNSLNFSKSFEKYEERTTDLKYSALSEEDILYLRNLDEKLSMNFKNNYFMKRINNIIIGEQIFVKINLENPLKINLSIKNITLIINKISIEETNNSQENKPDYNCGFCNIDIASNQTQTVIIKIVFNNPGIYEISGLMLTLFKNINIKYSFNKMRINSLYIYSKKFKDINNTNLKQSNFRFKVINAIKAISVVLNNNNENLILFKNQIYYLPLKIMNNNNDIEIRKFTVFLQADDNSIIYPKYLYNNYFQNNNFILIPIIGNRFGECKLKIIIKYEEKINNSNLDIYINVLSIKICNEINVNINDSIFEYNELNYKRKIKINMDIMNNNLNSPTISFIKNKFLIYNKNKFVVQELDNEIVNLEEFKDKNINKSFIIKCANKNEEEKENDYDKLFEDIIENKEIMNYNNILEFLKNIFCGENNLIFKYRLNFIENNNIININCLFIHEIKINDIPFNKTFYIDKSYIKYNLKNCFDINYVVEDLNENQKYININIKMISNNEYFEKIKQIIEYIEIKTKINNNNFEWIGIYSIVFNNLNETKSDEENIKTFNCLIDDKNYSLNDKNGNINLNCFIFNVKIVNSNCIYQFENIPYDIYYKIK